MSANSKAGNGAGSGQAALSRREALASLGLSAAIAYVAPTLVHLDRSANAQILPTPCRPGGGGGKGPRPCITPPTP